MKKMIMIGLSLVVAGCNSTIKPNEVLTPVLPVIEKDNIVKAPSQSQNFKLVAGNDPILEEAFTQYLKTGKSASISSEGFIKFAYQKENQPLIKTAPFQETVISLEPGERFTNITTGDPARWSFVVATSGSNPLEQHVLIKPSLANISTNMVIMTNKRMYNVKLVSLEGEPTKNVSFWYPDDMIKKVNEMNEAEKNDTTIANLSSINLSHLNFDYQLSGNLRGFPTWKPIRIFDDGLHTYIEFPHTIASQDLPVIFILDKENNKSLVNYRLKRPYFIVDKVFKKAILVVGVGKSQESIVITNAKLS